MIRQTTSAIFFGAAVLPVLGLLGLNGGGVSPWAFTVKLFNGTGWLIPAILIAGLFATASYLFNYLAIFRIGASTAMTQDIICAAWVMIFALVYDVIRHVIDSTYEVAYPSAHDSLRDRGACLFDLRRRRLQRSSRRRRDVIADGGRGPRGKAQKESAIMIKAQQAAKAGCFILLYSENHALDAWFGKNYIVEQDRKTPLLYNGSAVCQLHERIQQRRSLWE